MHLNEEKVVAVPGDDPSTQRKRSSLPMIDDLLEASKKNVHSSDTLPPLGRIQYCQRNSSTEELSGNKYFFTQIIGHFMEMNLLYPLYYVQLFYILGITNNEVKIGTENLDQESSHFTDVGRKRKPSTNKIYPASNIANPSMNVDDIEETILVASESRVIEVEP